MFSGTSNGLHIKGGEAAYAQYIRHLEKTSPAVKAMRTEGTVENFAQGYQDYLQAPLQVCSISSTHCVGFNSASQPLMDNLQSITYQTFEQDPIKYRQYEEVCRISFAVLARS